MPIRPMATGKKSTGRKVDSPPNKKAKKTNISKEEMDETTMIDPHKEEIDGLIREREEIRSKLNIICSKIIDNVNIENYSNDVDLTKQQPSDIPLDSILMMIDEICEYRTAFLNLYQETDDNENIPVRKKITQLSAEDPCLFRKRLTADQRLTFVVRERDLWKENAELLQIMYATVVDQLEMGIYKKLNIKTSEILRAHRLNLEDVCLIFSAPIIRSIHDAQKFREKKMFDKEINESKHQEVFAGLDQQEINNITLSNNNNNNDFNDMKERQTNSPSKTKRNVSFADQISVIMDNKEIDEQESIYEKPSPPPPPPSLLPKEKPLPIKPRLPLASDTLVDKMDPNLRMLIVKELSKDSQIPRPPSRKGSAHSPTSGDSHTPSHNRSRKKQPEWVNLARLIGIDESEIDHWLSQSLQYPAGRVLSTWCNCTSPSPTVAQLHSLVSSNELNRLDLARNIETMYYI